MLCRKPILFYAMCGVLLPVFAGAGDLPAITITDNTNPKIAELYQQLQTIQEKIDTLESERVGKLSENATAMRENGQRLENRALTSASTAATGLGGMQLGEGIAEKQADADAERDMRAYLATFRCEYGNGQSVTAGNEEIILPGGNELMDYYTEYKLIADRLKQTKAALGLRSGIESETLYDKVQSNLYQYSTTGITDGAYTSLSRALMDPDSKDANEWTAQKEKTKNKLTAGAVAAGIGVVGGIVGNAIINKDAPKEQSAQINSDYDAQVATVTNEQNEIQEQLNQAIAENAALVQEYNNQLQEHQNQIASINQAPTNCRELFADYISMVSKLSPIENETDNVPEIEFPDLSEQQTLLAKCSGCVQKGGVFNPRTLKCPCPKDKPVEKDGVCIKRPVKVVPIVPPSEENVVIPEGTPEDIPEETPNQDDLAICAVGKKHTAGFGIVAGKTRVGDRCTSALVLDGVVFKRKNGTCGCSARICETRNGRAATAEGGVCVCDKEKGYKDENGKCVKSTDESKMETTETAEPTQQSAEPEPKKEYKYYNCGNTNKGKDNWDMDTKKANPGVECEYINNVFNRHNVTPAEAEGLMKEWALENRKDTITCDEKSHRTQAEIDTYDDKWRNCVSTGPKEKYYEFVFKSLTNDNLGFYESLCSIYGLKQAGYKSACKKANKATCDKISAAVSRTFFHGGNAVLQGTECVINQSSNSNVSSSVSSGFQTTITASDDLHTISNVDLLQFYDKAQQVSANQDVYRIIRNYLFNDLRLPVKEFSCDAGFTDNIKYFKGTRQELSAIQKAQQDCIRNVDLENADSEISMCYAKHKIETISGDLLSCTYGGQSVDFLFKKLDAIWDRKSTAGYQAMLCASEGGYFTDKSCVLADKKACDDFNIKFKQQYPNSKGMEWDGQTCVLKDVKMVKQVQKVAETTGFVVLTLVSAVAGGPVVWALTAVEGTALVTEAVTARKLSDWAEKFLVDAAKCNNSNCADAVFKDHIARIIYGSRQFSEKQNKEIANQMSRLSALLDKDILDKMLDAGINFGVIDQNREPDLEKALCKYYDKKLTNSERALLGTKQISTFLTFATVIGAGVTAGLRQAFKRNWIHISPERQAKWLKYKILKPDDVAELGTKGAEAGDVARTMERSQAKKLSEIDARIAELEKKTNRSAEEAAELTNLRAERNRILNQVGTKDAAEVAAMQRAAYKPEVEAAQADYQKLLAERERYAKLIGTDKDPGRHVLQDIDRRIADQEKKLKDLGVDVEPVEPLWKPQANTPKPKAEVEAKPVDNTAKPKEPETNPTQKPVENGGAPATPQSRVYEKLGDKTKADIADIKSGKYKELYIPKGQLTDEEWKILKEDLAKDGLGITEDPLYFIIKKTNNVDDVAKASSKADDVADTGRGTTKNADDVLDESGKKPKENDIKTGADGIETINPTAQKLKELGFSENNGVFVSKRTLYSDKIKSQLDSMSDWKWTYLSVDGSSEGEKIYIAMSKETAVKQGLQWSDEAEDFIRTFNSQSTTNINKAKQLVSSGKPLTDVNGVPVYVRNFGKYRDKPIIMVEINGKKLPFYVSGGSGGKTTVATGKWEFFGGIGPDSWFNKSRNIDKIEHHYYSSELEKIAKALDSQVGDVRNVEYVMMSQGRVSLNGTGKVGGINGVTELSDDLINSGIEELGFIPRMGWMDGADENIEGVKSWLSKQRASAPSGGAAKSTGRASASGAKSTSTVANTTNKATSKLDDIAVLRGKADKNFNEYLTSIKKDAKVLGEKIPKNRLTDDEWKAINKSLESENVELVDAGGGYMQFMRTKANEAEIQRFINEGLHPSGAELYIPEHRFTSEQIDRINKSIASSNTKYVKQGDGYMKLVRITDFDISGAAKKFAGRIGKHNVYLEKIPTTNGGTSEVVNVYGRAVVVVNVDGHRIPFYVSSGQAGKDALGIPSGKWYPIAGIGENGTGWFNKMPDMNHNPVPELDEIVARLQKNMDAKTLKQIALDTNNGLSDALPTPSSAAGSIINSEFPNGVVPHLEEFAPGKYKIPDEYRKLFDLNIQRIINIFK